MEKEIKQADELNTGSDDKKPAKDLPEAAKRALAEAEMRRAGEKKQTAPKEIDGRDGPDPARYGDWEKKGIAVDF